MPIFDLYSKRQKRLRGEAPDVFTYDEIPQSLRVQIIQMWRDAIGSGTSYARAYAIYTAIHDILCREYGEFQLSKLMVRQASLEEFFQSTKDNEKVLDVIEVVFRFIDTSIREPEYQRSVGTGISPDEAITELNTRFIEHGIGYQYASGQIIRKDSELLHIEVVKPALLFLSDPEYQGANEEFLKAHEHYRHGNYKESINECLKAFESTMKTICHKHGWAYNQNDNAKKLIEICFANGLVPTYLQSQIPALKSVLESGIPTVRNKLGGHGQGAQQTVVHPHLVSYILHLTATTILLLVQSEKALP